MGEKLLLNKAAKIAVEDIVQKVMVLCQDLVQVKMRNFSHFNLPKAQP